jgi:L-alanine-DL-glutamate epimerase-like enolase superfamily enzyme
MKITRVEPIHLRLPTVNERCDGSQDTLIVKVYTDTGLVGVGEVDSSPIVVKAIIEAPLSHKICRGLAECVVGQDPFEIDHLIHRMYEGTIYFGRQGAVIQAMSGVEIALWDLVGKATGRPVYQLLGGAFRKKLRAYASILFGDTPAETERIGRELAGKGYRAVKFGWGPMGLSEESDMAHVRGARQGIGKDVELMVDAGLCWDRRRPFGGRGNSSRTTSPGWRSHCTPTTYRGTAGSVPRVPCGSRPVRRFAISRSFNS